MQVTSQLLHSLWSGTHSAVDHIYINVSLFGPFVPEIRVIQGDVCAVSRCYKTGLKADIRITSVTFVFPCLSQELVQVDNQLFFFFFYLSKRGSPSLRLDGNGLCPALQDLVNVLLAEFGPFVLLIHDGPVGAASQQIFNLLLGQLLLRSLHGKEAFALKP